ncbi:hypothetical protein [Tessaracoccus sp. OH4464_COT-324]|uniref:hypothetical protein n=1 Tax=Tessaracoccus sp. OH4464_COT-324 TaxID=2491059 RepID=UPI000F634875|nr:hypothetical protein [Tessaracoccus sp. OH4464_COT-324]RRD46892.1 hypothetical protein EII42_05540 [Tessaracoccus sp. OH4464_COT-324]
MTSFKVNPEALDSAGEGCIAVGAQVSGVAGQLSQPDPLMLGMFLAPLMAGATAFTSYSQQLIRGIGHGNKALGENLKATAKAYRDHEDQTVQQCTQFVGSIG